MVTCVGVVRIRRIYWCEGNGNVVWRRGSRRGIRSYWSWSPFLLSPVFLLCWPLGFSLPAMSFHMVLELGKSFLILVSKNTPCIKSVAYGKWTIDSPFLCFVSGSAQRHLRKWPVCLGINIYKVQEVLEEEKKKRRRRQPSPPPLSHCPLVWTVAGLCFGWVDCCACLQHWICV